MRLSTVEVIRSSSTPNAEARFSTKFRLSTSYIFVVFSICLESALGVGAGIIGTVVVVLTFSLLVRFKCRSSAVGRRRLTIWGSMRWSNVFMRVRFLPMSLRISTIFVCTSRTPLTEFFRVSSISSVIWTFRVCSGVMKARVR